MSQITRATLTIYVYEPYGKRTSKQERRGSSVCRGLGRRFSPCTEAIVTQQDKNTQTLNLPKDPPLVAVGETSRLVFHVSPLSGQGLLSDQTRAALRAILKLNGGAQIVHIRAFSAGNGDVRRIPQIVADVLGDKHGPLPSISVLQVGALTMHDAQIELEAASVGKKEVNKAGLTFHAAETAVATDPTTPLKSLLQKSVDQLAAKMNGKQALSVTCFVSDLDDAAALTPMIASRFPGAATNLVQPRRLAWQTEASCEGVSRDGGLKAERIAFSGSQVAFGDTEKTPRWLFNGWIGHSVTPVRRVLRMRTW